MKTYKTKLPLYELKKLQTEFPKAKITSSGASEEFIRQFYGDDIEIFESFFLLLLNNSNNTIGYAKISQGGITGTVVDVRIIAKYAVDSLATSVILAHNHPSGKTEPSRADRNITNKIKKGLEILDIRVLDHLVLSPEKGMYYSFADKGIL